MKKILLTLSAVFFISINAMAFNIYIDGFGAYVGAESANNQLGGGGSLFFGINKNFSAGMKFSQTSYTALDELKLMIFSSDMMINGGIEYNLQIGSIPLFWSSYLGFGMEQISVRKSYKDTIPPYAPRDIYYNDMGFAIAISTGIRWDFHPHIAIFLNVGFHAPFFGNTGPGGLKDWTVSGLTSQVGIRFAIWNNKPIDEQY